MPDCVCEKLAHPGSACSGPRCACHASPSLTAQVALHIAYRGENDCIVMTDLVIEKGLVRLEFTHQPMASEIRALLLDDSISGFILKPILKPAVPKHH